MVPVHFCLFFHTFDRVSVCVCGDHGGHVPNMLGICIAAGIFCILQLVRLGGAICAPMGNQ